MGRATAQWPPITQPTNASQLLPSCPPCGSAGAVHAPLPTAPRMCGLLSATGLARKEPFAHTHLAYLFFSQHGPRPGGPAISSPSQKAPQRRAGPLLTRSCRQRRQEPHLPQHLALSLTYGMRARTSCYVFTGPPQGTVCRGHRPTPGCSQCVLCLAATHALPPTEANWPPPHHARGGSLCSPHMLIIVTAARRATTCRPRLPPAASTYCCARAQAIEARWRAPAPLAGHCKATHARRRALAQAAVRVDRPLRPTPSGRLDLLAAG